MKKLLLLLGVLAASGGLASEYAEMENILVQAMDIAEALSKNIKNYIK